MKNSDLLQNLDKEDSKMCFKASNIRLNTIITTLSKRPKCLPNTFLSNLEKFIHLHLTPDLVDSCCCSHVVGGHRTRGSVNVQSHPAHGHSGEDS